MSSKSSQGHRKSFVLDTNVMLHNPQSLLMFADNEVVIPFAVLDDLDKFKKENNGVGRNARQIIRHLDELRTKGSLGEGVQWNDEGGAICSTWPVMSVLQDFRRPPRTITASAWPDR